MGKSKLLEIALEAQQYEIKELVKRVENIENKKNVTAPNINVLGNTSWANANTETAKALLNEHYAGKISIYDYWGIGDEREIMLGGEINETVQMVITDKAVYEKAVDGKRTGVMCAFTVDQKNLLANTKCSMNTKNTNKGGWRESNMQSWLRTKYARAFSENDMNLFTPFMLDWDAELFALRSEMEIFGETSYSDGRDGRQIEYYKTTRNRVKCFGDDFSSSSSWWERSPYYNGSSSFCSVNSGGGTAYSNASSTNGVAPFGCL